MQSFVTTAPPGNSGDNDFSSITALHYGDLLRVIALLFIRPKKTSHFRTGNPTDPTFFGAYSKFFWDIREFFYF